MDLLNKVQYAINLANIHYIRQKEAEGLGHSVWCASKFIGNEPFAVLLGGDDIVQSETSFLKQLMNKFKEINHSIIGVQTVPKEETNRYGRFSRWVTLSS